MKHAKKHVTSRNLLSLFLIGFVIFLGMTTEGETQDEKSSISLNIRIADHEIVPYQPLKVIITLKNNSNRILKNLRPNFNHQYGLSWMKIKYKDGSFKNIKSQTEGTVPSKKLQPGEKQTKIHYFSYPEMEIETKNGTQWEYAFQAPGKYFVKWLHRFYKPDSSNPKFLESNVSTIKVKDIQDTESNERIREIAKSLKWAHRTRTLMELKEIHHKIKRTAENLQDSEYRTVLEDYKKIVKKKIKERKELKKEQ